MKIKKNHLWQNSLQSQVVTANTYFEPETLDDLVKIVTQAEIENKRVRAVGSGHSFSDIALCEDFLVNPRKITGLQPLDEEVLSEKGKALDLVDVKAGMTIHDFNKALDGINKAIINMGGVDHQTMSGAICTGTHGSGIDLPALSGIVESLVMVTGGGKTYRIEPSDGITDQAKYTNIEIPLIQDDDVFNTAVVNLGSMGIVFSYIVTVRPMYWIHESRTLHKWEDIKAKLQDPSQPLFKDNRAVMIRVNPYLAKKNYDHTVLIIEHKEILSEPPRGTIHDRNRNIPSCIGGVFAPFYIKLIRWLPWLANIPNMVETSMTSAVDANYTNRAHKVLFLGQEKTKENGYDAEFGFDMADTKYVDLIQDLIDTANETKKTKGIFHSGQIGLRYVKRSDQFLTPEYKKDVCYVDTSFLYGYQGHTEMLDIYQEVFFKHEGIPHWGKVNNKLDERVSEIPNMYPALDKWQEQCDKYDPKRTFANKFTDRFKLREGAANVT